MVGLTLSEENLACWVLSLPVYTQVYIAMDSMLEDEVQIRVKGRHKEEGMKRRKLDAEYRNRIRNELKWCGNPLKCEKTRLLNMVNNCVAKNQCL